VTAIPDGVEQVIPAHQTVAVTNEVFEQVEDLRLHGHQCSAPAQFAPSDVENELIEQVQQLMLRDGRIVR
jgi:hypothetical protein